MVSAQTGDAYDDKRDAVVMAARWPRMAKSLHESLNLPGYATSFRNCDRNLATRVECRSVLHEKQKQEKVIYINSTTALKEVRKKMAREEMVVVRVFNNRDPRAFKVTPQLVAFSAPGFDVFAYFPISMDSSLLTEVESFLVSKILFVRNVDYVTNHLKKDGDRVRIIRGGGLALKMAGGRGDDSIASFVWGRRFCQIAKEEWMTDPLTPVQERHVAYGVDLVVSFVRQIGLSEAMRVVENM